jgi:hypothetical protein
MQEPCQGRRVSRIYEEVEMQGERRNIQLIRGQR